MKKELNFPTYDAGGRVKTKKFPSGQNPSYQKYLDSQSFGKAFNLAKSAGAKELTYKGKKYNTKTKDQGKKK